MLLHVPPEAGVQLIEVPLAPLGAYFPGLRPLLNASPAEVIATAPTGWTRSSKAAAGPFLERLSERQSDVLRAFAEGLAPAPVADRLTITLKTVDAHKTAILAECRVAWNLPEDERLSYHWLREKFGRYFDGLGV